MLEQKSPLYVECPPAVAVVASHVYICFRLLSLFCFFFSFSCSHRMQHNIGTFAFRNMEFNSRLVLLFVRSLARTLVRSLACSFVRSLAEIFHSFDGEYRPFVCVVNGALAVACCISLSPSREGLMKVCVCECVCLSLALYVCIY